MAIQFFFLQQNIALAERTTLKAFINGIFKKEKRKLQSLTYIFCSDEYLLEINKSHLKHNYYTDIITFDLSGTPEAITGEIYISTDRVRDNAAIQGVTIKEELHRVIFHGALHLCGYKDKTPSDAKQMRVAEDRCLSAYFK
ncbi:rRNA maturation RNase YbeY [Ferruginibacter sp. SUN106]|uniref:rRNA maturation RNase YbeY n=1 Tax=Ferruginibacter sp. SUN106 TaxID=2978348 RepID=UPI003D36BE1E